VSKRPDDWDYMSEVAKTTPEGIQADVGACVVELRRRGAASIFTVGFCFGGRNSWLAAAAGHRLAGAVGFYGSIVERNGNPGPISFVDRMDCPILALQAGADANITREQNGEFERALAEAGVEHELVEYEGAPHSFFDRKQEEFAEASEDAWRRVLSFVESHT
jgi:carboxymethylenebutenolidase